MSDHRLFPEMFGGRPEPGTDGPDIPRIQPEPRTTHVCHVMGLTAIARVWEEGDTQRCRLCPNCCADHAEGVCLVVIHAHVADADAPLFAVRGELRTRPTDQAPPFGGRLKR